MFRRCLIPWLAIFSFFSCCLAFAQDSIDSKKIFEIRKKMAKKIDDKIKHMRKKMEIELDLLREQLIEELDQELQQLEKDITSKPGFWGMSMYPISPGLKILLQIPKEKNGFVVLETLADSPARDSGLQPLDVVTQLNNFVLKGASSEVEDVFQKLFGKQEVEIEAFRSGRQRVFRLKLAENKKQSPDLILPENVEAIAIIQKLFTQSSLDTPSSSSNLPDTPSSDDEILTWYQEWQKSKTFIDLDPIAFLGVAVQDFSNQERQRLKIPTRQRLGVRIVEILPNSPAEASKELKASDVIWKIDQQDITSPKKFQQLIHKKSPGDSIVMLIVSDDSTRKVIHITLGVRKTKASNSTQE